MVSLLPRKLVLATVIVASVFSFPASSQREHTASEYTRTVLTVGELTVYIGIMPAEVLQGHPKMHGGTLSAGHQYYLVAAIFDKVSGVRITDAAVTATVSGLGLSGAEKALKLVNMAEAVTFGGFFELPDTDLYAIRIDVRRPGSPAALAFDFKYNHLSR